MRGFLRQRSPGSWSLAVDVGRDPVTGKRKQSWSTFRGTKKQAEDRLTELVRSVNREQFMAPSKMTLIEWLRTWLDTSIKPHLRPSTYDLYKVIVEHHLANASLGAMPMQKIRPSHVEQYLNQLKAAPSTVGVHLAVLHGAFGLAVRDKLILETPVIKIRRKKAAKDARQQHAKVQCWTAEEARRVLQAATEAGTQTAAWFALALDSGARKSELLGLGWQHIDFDEGTLTIDRQITSRRGDPVYGPTKTGNTRVLDLDQDTLARLWAHKTAQAVLKMANRTTYADHGLVFAKEPQDLQTRQANLGDPMVRVLDLRVFKAVVKVAGVRSIKVHGTRHTVATLMLTASVPVHEVAARLGHKNAMQTLSTYAHALPREKGQGRSKMGAVLYG